MTINEKMELNSRMKERVAINTKKAYASDLAYIQQWAHITFGNSTFPVTEDAILLFITDHLQGMEEKKEKELMSPLLKNGYKANWGPHSLKTVRRRLSALTAYHRERGYDDPFSYSSVKYLIDTISKTEKKTIQQRPITQAILDRLLTTCKGSTQGIRNKAILLLAWTSGARRSEIAAAQVEHLTSMGEDFLLHIPTSNPKRDSLFDVPVRGNAAQALRDWMAATSVKQGAIFRSVNKHGKISVNPLSPVDVNRVVKHCCKAAGFDENQFSAHSLRLGFLMQISSC
jgi:integrase